MFRTFAMKLRNHKMFVVESARTIHSQNSTRKMTAYQTIIFKNVYVCVIHSLAILSVQACFQVMSKIKGRGRILRLVKQGNSKQECKPMCFIDRSLWFILPGAAKECDLVVKHSPALLCNSSSEFLGSWPNLRNLE